MSYLTGYHEGIFNARGLNQNNSLVISIFAIMQQRVFYGVASWTGVLDWSDGVEYWSGFLEWNLGMQQMCWHCVFYGVESWSGLLE